MFAVVSVYNYVAPADPNDFNDSGLITRLSIIFIFIFNLVIN